MTSFSTFPSITFPSSSVAIQRDTGLASGQLNFLMRSNPSVFPYLGFRWWHQLYDELLKNFNACLEKRQAGQPLFYWFGPTNVHRKWIQGSGKELWSIDPDSLKGKLPEDKEQSRPARSPRVARGQ